MRCAIHGGGCGVFSWSSSPSCRPRRIAGLHPREALRPRHLVAVGYFILVLSAVGIMAIQDWQGFLTAPPVGIAVYLLQVVPYWFGGKDRKDLKDSKDIKKAA